MTRNVADDASNPDKVTPVSADRLLIIDSETAPNSLKEIRHDNFAAWFNSLIGSLSNKTINFASNTIQATLAQLNAAITDADVASLNGAETLASKTLTTPTIGSFVNAGHNHLDAAGGGTPPVNTWSVTWGGLTVGNGTLTARYTQIGKLVMFHCTFVFGTTSSVAVGAITFELPVAPQSWANNMPIGVARFKDTAAGVAQQGVVQLQASGSTCVLIVFDSSATYAGATVVTNALPFTWGTGDDFEFSGYYIAS